MNPFFERLLYSKKRKTQHGNSDGVSLFPVSEESKIILNFRKHLDGKYSFEVKSEKSGNEELDEYVKWFAGSIVRSLKKFDEIVTASDSERIGDSTFDNTVGKMKVSE